MTFDYRNLSAIIYFIGLSLVSHFISRRAISEWSWQGIKRLTWLKVCVLCILVDSWMSLFTSGFLTLAIGLEENLRVCSAAIFSCITFYTTSKFFIYSFLTEKVHIVWSNMGESRFKSPVYVICFILVAMYTVLIVIAVFVRVYFIRNSICVIGVKLFAAIGLVTYDIVMNLLLTALFLYPLLRSKARSRNIRRVALRTFIASAAALTTSTVNILILVTLHGKEDGWVCLASCSGDVLVNACAVYWATTLNSEGDKYTVATFTSNAPNISAGTNSSRRPLRASLYPSAVSTVVYGSMGTTGTLMGSCIPRPIVEDRGAAFFAVSQRDRSRSEEGVMEVVLEVEESNAPPRSRPSQESFSSRESHKSYISQRSSEYQPTLTTEDEIIRAAFSHEQEIGGPQDVLFGLVEGGVGYQHQSKHIRYGHQP